MKDFVVDLIEDTNVDTGEARVGVVAYSDDADVIFSVKSFLDVLFVLVVFICFCVTTDGRVHRPSVDDGGCGGSGIRRRKNEHCAGVATGERNCSCCRSWKSRRLTCENTEIITYPHTEALYNVLHDLVCCRSTRYNSTLH